MLCLQNAPARTWTNSEGQTIEADFIKLEGQTDHLDMSGRIYQLAMKDLSQEDRDYIDSLQKESETPVQAKFPLELTTKIAGSDIPLKELAG